MEKIMPFVWMNEETPEELAGEIRFLRKMGLDSFIVESRVHEDFCGERWFEEIEYLLKLAQENGMKLWVLDDKSYPTGYANGALKDCYPEDNAWHIKVEKTDVAGEARNAKILLQVDLAAGDEILGVFLAKRTAQPDHYEEIVDVTDGVCEDLLYVDVPQGAYSVLTVVKTLACSERRYYLDMLSKKSVRRLIDAVYEPHYKRFAKYFGNTFAGFFTDEPRFSNGRYGYVHQTDEYHYQMGIFGIAYPWSDEVYAALNVPADRLLALWFDIGEGTEELRVRYMETVTTLYGECFTAQLAEWCHAHGILYTGHIIEDMGAHARLGCSSGHYFRSMKGADMASIDVVLHQIKPFDRTYPHYAPISAGYADPLFFDYTLAKLASSDARLDPAKQGRACCEIFGAYGWAESTDEMLYLTNHMLVRGINRFIPHAFYHRASFADCPPHFYIGRTTQTDESYGKLFRYMDRMCELLDGGVAEVDTAVLYHAQAEWTGRAYTPIDPICKHLTDRQINFDIVDFDALARAEITPDGFAIGTCRYRRLYVPQHAYLPAEYEQLLAKFAAFVAEPESDGTPAPVEGLRVYAYRKNGERYVFAVNECERETVCENPDGYAFAVDYLNGICRRAGGAIRLAPGEAVVLRNDADGTVCLTGLEEQPVAPALTVAVQGFDEESYTLYRENVDYSFDVNARDAMPHFSGWIRFTCKVDLTGAAGLAVHYRADGCRVLVDGKEFVGCGRTVNCLLDRPVTGYAEVEIVLRNSMAYRTRDHFSKFGLIGACMLDGISVFKKS